MVRYEYNYSRFGLTEEAVRVGLGLFIVIHLFIAVISRWLMF
jgi:hypothetical protein